jgi:hypothetical protein
LSAITASSAVSPVRLKHPASTAGSARLHAYGGRSAQQQRSATSAKYDAALADIARHLSGVRSGHEIEDLRALNPAARFARSANGAAPMVLIDAVTRGDPQQLKTALTALGLERSAVFSNDVSGWLPVAELDAATARGEVAAIRAAMPRKRTGAVTSQGDFVQHSDVVRSSNSLSGAGITVGILSDSYNCYSVYAANGVPASGNEGYASNGFTATADTDIATGDLASGVTVVEEATCLDYNQPQQLPFGDEGRAMMQIVHDVAPGASLAFYTAENGEADFASGIKTLAADGAKIIADDVGYFDEPFFQDGLVAQAVDSVEAGGVAYFSAAGNNGTLAYDNDAPSFATVSTTGPNSGEHLLNFDTTGATTTTTLPVTIPALIPGEYVAIVLEWDQPYITGAPDSGGATSTLDLCVSNVVGNDTVTNDDLQSLPTSYCTGANSVGSHPSDPVQIIIVGNPANSTVSPPNDNSSTTTLNIVVGLVSGAAPGRIKVVVEDDGAGSTINQFATNSGTLQGHPGAAGAMAVGAAFYFDTPACGQSPAMLEYFSSAGGDPILFDVNGNRLATPVTRQKPDIAGPDGGNDTFLGFTLASAGYTGSNGLLSTSISSCQNLPAYPNFFGTSAATPHVAGIAALLLQANDTLSPSDVYTALKDSVIPVVDSNSNAVAGYGFVQADTAATLIAATVPGAPTLTLAQSAIDVGGSTTITWSSANTTGCTASGSWSGTLASNGTQTLSPTAAGTYTYTLACTNTAGTSAATSVTLTVTTVTIPAAPTLTLANPSIVVGGITTLTWSSSGATSCTASGSWSGTLATSGSQSVTGAAAGTQTYSLTCSNSAGTSAAASATLTVTAASSGGGGALDLGALLALASLAGLRFRRRSSSPRAH